MKTRFNKTVALFERVVDKEPLLTEEWEAYQAGMPSNQKKKHRFRKEHIRSAECARLMEIVGLELCYYEAVLTVLHAGKWRSAINPASFVRTAAMREGLRRGQGFGALEVHSIENEGKVCRLQSRQANMQSIRKRSIDVNTRAYNDRYRPYDPREEEEPASWKVRLDSRSYDDNGRVIPSYAGRELNMAVLSPDRENPNVLAVDWNKVLETAGCDESEVTVFKMKYLEDLGRKEILARAGTAVERKEWQAAYRRLHRKLENPTVLRNFLQTQA